MPVVSAACLGMLSAAEIRVAPGQSIQTAIEGAEDGDTIVLEAGRYTGSIDYSGKAITIRGVGPETVIDGDREGTVVRFVSGEGRRSVLDSVQITGGLADNGGGILVVESSPVVQRSVLVGNIGRDSGAGVYVRGSRSRPLIRNNIVAFNLDPRPQPTSDAHQIFVDNNASAVVLNNTIVRGNGNGILLQPSRNQSVVLNNILAWNGSRLSNGAPTGRGICDFSGTARVQFNIFHRNVRSAVLSGSLVDYELVSTAENVLSDSRFRNNLDANPRLRESIRRRPLSDVAVTSLLPRSSSPVVNSGHPGRRFRDQNGSRNDIGHSGGPAGWR